MPIPRERLRLSADERAKLLKESRVAHCATVGPDGSPHVVPLWFVFDGDRLWVSSLRRSKRGAHLAAGSRVSLCVDAGTEYSELRGVVLDGSFRPDEAPAEVRRRFSEKYWGGHEVPEVRSHEWFRLDTEREASWDFRRIQEAGSDPRLDALEQG